MNFALENFDGFLIDFDGTLASTEPIHQRCLREFFAKKGCEFTDKEPGKSTLHIFRDKWNRMEDAEMREQYLSEYLELLPGFLNANRADVKIYPDAQELLKRTVYLPRVLVTGSFLSWIEAVNDEIGILEQFSHRVTKEDLLPDREKPHPYAYKLAAQKLGLSSEQCVAFEDSAVGVLSAKNAGCFVVAVIRDSTKDFEYADIVVESFAELFD